jgi:hypothetical protein
MQHLWYNAKLMKYIIVKKFGPQSEGWQDYAKWNRLEHCSEYCSIDAINRNKLFNPETPEDWKNCVDQDFGIHMITNLEFAKKILPNFDNADIVGVIKNPKTHKQKIPANHELMGYDIIDGFNDTSLITNWGGLSDGIEDLKLNQAALVEDMAYAYDLRDMLHKNFADDSHAENCEVWAIYKVKS